MKQAWMIVAALCMCGIAALADAPVSEADAQKIRPALQALGCSGGKMEQETEGTSVYEVDDAKCRDGQYDIKLDKDFKIVSMTRD
jgi:hypothetical protein